MSKKKKTEAAVELPAVGSPCLYYKDSACDPCFGFVAGQCEAAVNVAYFDCTGRAENAQTVPFVADGAEPPEGHFCCFTPPAPPVEKGDAVQE